jgi:hypothetical protein
MSLPSYAKFKDSEEEFFKDLEEQDKVLQYKYEEDKLNGNK